VALSFGWFFLDEFLDASSCCSLSVTVHVTELKPEGIFTKPELDRSKESLEKIFSLSIHNCENGQEERRTQKGMKIAPPYSV